jgi:hypothetical protein
MGFSSGDAIATLSYLAFIINTGLSGGLWAMCGGPLRACGQCMIDVTIPTKSRPVDGIR